MYQQDNKTTTHQSGIDNKLIQNLQNIHQK